MSIYKKLLDIQKSVRGFGKDKNGHGYQYVSGAKILTHIRSKMDELGLLLKQEVLSIENIRQDYRTGVGTKYEKPKSEILAKVMMQFTWVCVDTGEKDVNLFGANGQNDWDKGVGSALTYGERYFLLKYFHIPTDEDDIDNPDRKPPTDEDDNVKKKGAGKGSDVKEEDNRPWLSDDNFNKILARINKGEKLLKQTSEAFKMKTAYKETLQSAENNYKPSK